MTETFELMTRGGAIIWIIAGLSVVTLAVIVWKVARLWRLGAWGDRAAEAVADGFRANRSGDEMQAGGMRLRVVQAAISAMRDANMSDTQAREETERVARRVLADAREGLRLLDVIASVAPLLGLLGTVLGMIAAFQALQTSGSRADPSVLAGGIWQALLTTAAGMGVAIPAAMALAWFETVIDRVAGDMEDLATRIFLSAPARSS